MSIGTFPTRVIGRPQTLVLVNASRALHGHHPIGRYKGEESVLDRTGRSTYGAGASWHGMNAVGSHDSCTYYLMHTYGISYLGEL